MLSLLENIAVDIGLLISTHFSNVGSHVLTKTVPFNIMLPIILPLTFLKSVNSINWLLNLCLLTFISVALISLITVLVVSDNEFAIIPEPFLSNLNWRYSPVVILIFPSSLTDIEALDFGLTIAISP